MKLSESSESSWELKFKSKIADVLQPQGVPVDPAHDLLYVERVVATAKRLCEIEKADPEIVIPAAWLHDLVNLPKNDPRRSQASKLSGEEACRFLKSIGYLQSKLDAIGLARLFVVADSLQTEAGRAEGARRRLVLETYLKDLSREI